jgi:hypothetical protein
MAKKNDINNIEEPEETITQTEEIDAEEVTAGIQDPILSAETIDREYSRGSFGDKPEDGEIIEEPIIQEPEFETKDDDLGSEEEILGGGGSGNKRNNSYYDEEDYSSRDTSDKDAFELNGDVGVYLLEFGYGLFKNAYKITPELLERKGIPQGFYTMNINTQHGKMKFSDFADTVNNEIDDIQIDSKDKKILKKAITAISEKRDIKMTPEAQLLTIVGKIGIETHIQCSALVGSVVDFLENANMDNRPPNNESTILDPDQVQSSMADNDVVEVEEVQEQINNEDNYARKKRKYNKSGKYSKKGKNLKKVDITNLSESGED